MDDQTLDEMGSAALEGIFEGGYETDPFFAQPAGAAVSEGDNSQPRGPDGRFIADEPATEEPAVEEQAVMEVAEESPLVAEEETETDEEPVAEVDTEEAEAPVEETPVEPLYLDLDQETLDLLDSKYGGDIAKALTSLRESERVIGRQGNELGELRELKSQLDNLQNLISLQQQGQGIDWDEIIEEDPQQAVMMAAQYQNPQAFEQAIEAWAQVEPIKAFTFLQDVTNQTQMVAPEAPQASLESEIDNLKGRYPDLQQRLPAIQQAAAERPMIAAALNGPDPRARVQALEDLYHLSRSRETPDTSKAARQVVLRAKAEAEQIRQDAAVVSASNQSQAETPPPVSGDEALRETLQEYLGLGDDFVVR